MDLPPVVGSIEDQARLELVTPLYLVAELDAAQLLIGAEMLSGLVASGGLTADLGPSASPLITFWRTRNDRFTTDERRALFARLFGGPAATGGPTLAVRRGGSVNDSFEPLLADVAAAMSDLTTEPGHTARGAALALRTSSLQLAANLVDRSTGIPDLAARELLATVREALNIFEQPQVQAVLRARSVWDAVREAARRYLRRDPPVAVHVTRGKSGLVLLGWLADALPTLSGDDALMGRRSTEAIGAATAWMQATLALHERSP